MTEQITMSKSRTTKTRKPAKTAKKRVPAVDGDGEKNWRLRLYVAGQTPKSLTAFANLKRLCDEHLTGKYDIEVIDLVENPQLAQGDQIVAVPTLVRKLPEPFKRVIGNLSDAERFLVGMDLKRE